MEELLKRLFSDGLLVQNFHPSVILISVHLILFGVAVVYAIKAGEDLAKTMHAYNEATARMVEGLIMYLGERRAKRAEG